VCIARCMVLAATLLLASSLEARADEAAKRSSWFGFGAKPTSDAKLTTATNSAKTPPVFTKVSDGTKSFFTSTKNIFSSKKGKSSQHSGVTSHYSTRNKQPEPGFFKKLFYTQPAPPPKTVEEWMSLEQVHP
jgi:hypothetical protein